MSFESCLSSIELHMLECNVKRSDTKCGAMDSINFAFERRVILLCSI